MNDQVTGQELTGTRELLQKLFEEVKRAEFELSEDSKLGPAGGTIQRILLATISLGEPSLSLFTKELYEEMCFKLPPISKHQMETGKKHDFYGMSLTAGMTPDTSAVQFSKLECYLDFAPKGSNGLFVERMRPEGRWKEYASNTTEIHGNIDVSVSRGISCQDSLGKANVGFSMKNNFIANLFNFSLGRSEIVVSGEGNSYCSWLIETPELKKSQLVPFTVVFKVPKDIISIKLTAQVSANVDLKWLMLNLEDVWRYLSDAIIMRIKGLKRLPIVAEKEWTLALPKEE